MEMRLKETADKPPFHFLDDWTLSYYWLGSPAAKCSDAHNAGHQKPTLRCRQFQSIERKNTHDRMMAIPLGKRAGWQRSSKIYLVFAVAAILLLIHLSSKRALLSQPYEFRKAPKKEASTLSPAELMSRPLPGFQTHIPKIFHQSWSSNQLPAKFEKWSEGCRKVHPDWEWVLWTDDDNMELVRRYMPSMLPTFEKLNGPIFRADLIRNAYMLLFGG
jgi:hypothetical protein